MCLPMAWETGVEFQVVIPKTQKTVLDAALLNTRHYNIWGNPEKGVVLPPTPQYSS